MKVIYPRSCVTVLLSFFVLSNSGAKNFKTIKQIKSENMKINVELLTKGHGIIWGMDFLHPQKIIFTEREGVLKTFDFSSKAITMIKGLPEIFPGGQGGLLDVRVRKVGQKDLVYLTYTGKKGGKKTTNLAVAELLGNKLKGLKVLFSGDKASNRGVHFGSRITWGSDQKLYFSVGDRGDRDKAQDLSVHNGKILRLNFDGSIPNDNPFKNRKNAKPEIWSYGHRNPQGLTTHPQTGKIWEQEHGPRGGDEINIIQKGKNYGWPVITYGKEYWGPSIGEGTKKVGMVQPIKQYTPSIAPSGLTFYWGDKYPKWKGDLFSGALKLQHVNRLVLKNGKAVKEERFLNDFGHRIRNIIQGPDQLLYFSSDRGFLMRFVPARK